MKKNLIIDCQVFQTFARHRGMGRYSEYLLNSIVKQSVYEKVIVVLSKNNKGGLSYEDETALFGELEVAHLDLVDSSHNELAMAEAYNLQTLNAYIKDKKYKKDETDYLLLAPFQEPLVSMFPENVNKFLIFYDLIPYLYHEQYVHKMPFEKYLRHYKLLFQADKLLAISESVKSDLCLYLGVNPSRVEAIHGAAIRSVLPPRKPTSFTLPSKFVLLPTGDDPRKNNPKAVAGFELFNARNNNAYKLVITSDIHFSEKANLQKISNNIIFTGNLHESELDWLYDESSVVLFVSDSEGLGLPILEAVGSNSRVVCSPLDVFREISTDALYYCDQKDEASIAEALGRAVKTNLTKNQQEEYKRIVQYYSWEETAKRATAAMQNTITRKKFKKKKVAVFTPRPDGISAIGKVVAETHPAMIEYFDVDYFYEDGINDVSIRPNYLQYIANYYPAENFSVSSYADYDAVFYHIGNSDYHLRSIANGLYLPGYAIIHDTNISDAYRVMAEKDVISRERADLEARITKIGNFNFSNNLASLLNNQIGVVTHSDFALSAVREITKSVYACKANLPTKTPTLQIVRDYKKLSLGLAGIIADIKGTEVIEGLIKNPKNDKHDFLLFGYSYSADSTMKRLKSYANVKVETNVTDFDFVNKIRQLDIFINYRMKYQGETSLSTLEAMRQGVVVVVRNIGWYSELPDDAVVKVNSIEEVAEKVEDLVSNPEKIKEIAARAITYIEECHSHDGYVGGLAQLIKSSSQNSDNQNIKIQKLLKSRSIKTKYDLMKERLL